jgi:hypothetical protein
MVRRLVDECWPSVDVGAEVLRQAEAARVAPKGRAMQFAHRDCDGVRYTPCLGDLKLMKFSSYDSYLGNTSQ